MESAPPDSPAQAAPVAAAEPIPAPAQLEPASPAPVAAKSQPPPAADIPVAQEAPPLPPSPESIPAAVPAPPPQPEFATKPAGKAPPETVTKSERAPVKVVETKPEPKTEAKAEAKPATPVAEAKPVETKTVEAAPAVPAAPKKPFSRPLSRDVDPVILTGAQLKTFLGKSNASIRLSAVRANGLEPIPYQIDERNKDNDYVFTAGPDKDDYREKDFDKDNFDANDELVFMARDLGEQMEDISAYPTFKGAKPAVLKEIVIKDPIDGKRGYAYLTSWSGDAPTPSKTDYVNYKSAEDLVEATSFAVGFNKETPFAIDRSMIRLSDGKFSDNRVDILKVRLKSTIWGFYSFNRNQDDFGAKTAAWIDGPVRSILHKGISVRMILGIQSPKIWNDTIFYPYGLSYGIDVITPFSIPSIFSKFEMFSGMDFRDLRGGTFYTNGMSKPITITGNPNSPELAALNANPDENRFAAIGWAGSYFIMRIQIPPEIPLKVNTYLIDDPNYVDGPERFPGAVPGMYFQIDDWLKVQQKKFSIVTTVTVTDTFQPGQEKSFIGRMDRPVTMENPDKLEPK